MYGYNQMMKSSCYLVGILTDFLYEHLDFKLVKIRYRSVMIDLRMLTNAMELSFILTS